MPRSPSLDWVAPARRKRGRTQSTLEEAFSGPSGRLRTGPTESVQIVDLFCGCGGFSQGGHRAGHTVALAVDADADALEAHSLNHPSTGCLQQLTLPDPRLEAELLPPVRASARRWHLHGSPPCTRLSAGGGTNRSEDDRIDGMRLVRWFLDLVERAGADSWSMEQVAQEDVVAELERRRQRRPDLFDHQVVWMSHYGVPQARKRVIAGTPWLISRLRDRAEPLRVRRVVDTLPCAPPGACGIKGRRTTFGREQCKRWAKPFLRPVNCVPMADRPKRGGLRCPAPTVIAGAPHRWSDERGATIRILSVAEHAALQTLGAAYKLPFPYAVALRLVGNAIPPLFVEQLMKDYRVPLWVEARRR